MRLRWGCVDRSDALRVAEERHGVERLRRGHLRRPAGRAPSWSLPQPTPWQDSAHAWAGGRLRATAGPSGRQRCLAEIVPARTKNGTRDDAQSASAPALVARRATGDPSRWASCVTCAAGKSDVGERGIHVALPHPLARGGEAQWRDKSAEDAARSMAWERRAHEGEPWFQPMM